LRRIVMPPPAISVIIPTYQRCTSVTRALRALTQQTISPDRFEVIVSIDGSEDGTREGVAGFVAPYALHGIWAPNSGRASACNAGIRAARGELVVLLDDDMEPVPHFLDAHARAHRSGARLGVLGAVPIGVGPESPPIVLFVAEKFNRHLEVLARPGHKIGIRDFYTGNFSIPREILFEAGLFDEGFKLYGNEDGELAIRLQAKGIDLVYSSEALARQHYEKDFAALARDKLAQGRTSVACAARHPESIPNLRIGTYRRGSRKWRLLRSALLAASRPLRSLPNWIVDYIKWLEQRRSPSLPSRYYLALDYFYWLGVRLALHEQPGAIGRLAL
jgi:glycosyltransferase involved in cell wall biosynthesis